MRHRLSLFAVLLPLLLAAPAHAAGAESSDALASFFTSHPRYEVLPAPYFAPGQRAATSLDLALDARAWLGPNVAWHAELDAGAGASRRYPAAGTTMARGWKQFMSMGDRPAAPATLTLYSHEHGTARPVMTLRLDGDRPQRFRSAYVRGPFARQISRDWGEEGAWLVRIDERVPAAFWRHRAPVLYVGGDFNYQRIEGTVRYLRTHGVNALGYKPDYDRDERESFLEMAHADLPDVRTLLSLASGGQPADVIGLCVGGLHARGLAYAERQMHPARPLIASVTTVGTPHHGSELADVYNAVELLPAMHRFFTGDARIHRYKDAREDVKTFNATVGDESGLPTASVVLDPDGERPDPRYDSTDWPLRVMVGHERGVSPQRVKTDGLITVDGQTWGRRLATWKSDHAGMINDGRSATYFDAYAAHLKLIESLGDR